jgi:hypothetical protein
MFMDFEKWSLGNILLTILICRPALLTSQVEFVREDKVVAEKEKGKVTWAWFIKL